MRIFVSIEKNEKVLHGVLDKEKLIEGRNSGPPRIAPHDAVNSMKPFPLHQDRVSIRRQPSLLGKRRNSHSDET